MIKLVLFAFLVLAGASPAWGAGAFVQGKYEVLAAGGTVTLTSATTAGNTLVACFHFSWASGNPGVPTRTGDTYALIDTATNATGDFRSRCYYAYNIQADSDATTFPDPGAVGVAIVMEISGVLTTDPLDVHAATNGNSTTPAGGSVTATATGFAIGYANTPAEALSPGAGFSTDSTVVRTFGATQYQGFEWKNVSAGAINAVWTSNTGQWVAHTIVFKDATTATRNRIW